MKLLKYSLLAAVLCSHAGAVVLLDSNLDGTQTNGTITGTGKALGFTLGTTAQMGVAGYQLDSIVVRLGTGATAPSASEYTFALYASDSTGPGALLQTFTSTALVLNTVANYTFSLANPYLLAPSTTYWIVATNTATSNFNWRYSGTFDGTLAPGVTANATTYYGTGSPTGWASTSVNYSDLQINATVIPEPSASLAALLGAGVLFIRRRRD